MTIRKIVSYEHRILVFGTRYFTDTTYFHIKLSERLNLTLPHDMSPDERIKNVGFISGAAHSGADRMVINWAKHFGYYCEEFPADWDKYNSVKGKNPAGMIRNNEMVLHKPTYYIGFVSGHSPGSNHMIKLLEEQEIDGHVYTITPEQCKKNLY